MLRYLFSGYSALLSSIEVNTTWIFFWISKRLISFAWDLLALNVTFTGTFIPPPIRQRPLASSYGLANIFIGIMNLLGRFFKAQLSQPRVSENFDFSFVTFWLGNLLILFAIQFCAVVISNYMKRLR